MQLGMRAAHLLEDFGKKWEISDVNDRNVDLALRSLLAALAGMAGLAGLLVWQIARWDGCPQRTGYPACSMRVSNSLASGIGTRG
jgi:hypothetical protein